MWAGDREGRRELRIQRPFMVSQIIGAAHFNLEPTRPAFTHIHDEHINSMITKRKLWDADSIESAQAPDRTIDMRNRDDFTYHLPPLPPRSRGGPGHGVFLVFQRFTAIAPVDPVTLGSTAQALF